MIVPGVVAHSFNISTGEVEAGRSLGVGGQPGLGCEFQDGQSNIVRPSKN